MACTTKLVCLLVAATKMPLEEAVLVADSYQNLSNPLFISCPWVSTIDNILNNGMYHLACFSVSGRRKNALGRGSASSGLITKLEQSTFLRYLWFQLFVTPGNCQGDKTLNTSFFLLKIIQNVLFLSFFHHLFSI
jgi:hypothetical protein